MRLVIVEDEIRIREGLIHLLNNLNRDIEVVGVAENGAEGLEVAKLCLPDLIITDIRMPMMDGLKMLEQLHERCVPCKAIVLSAYSEFAYAQQAIKLGVSEYLIKPIAPDELLQAIKNIEAQLDHERSRKAQSPQQFRTLKNIFYSILLGSMVMDDDLHAFLKSAYKLDSNGTYAIMDIYLGANYPQCNQALCSEMSILLEGASFGYSFVEHPQGGELMLILYGMENPDATERYMQHLFISQIKSIAEYDMASGWVRFGGLGKMREHLAKLRKCLDWSMIFGKKALIAYPAVDSIQFESLPYPIELESKAKTELCALEYEKLSETFSSFINHLKARIYSPVEVKETTIRFLWAIISVMKETDHSISDQLEQQTLMETIVTAITWSELSSALKMLQDALHKIRHEQVSSMPIRRAKSMVHECYNQGITLEVIACKLNLTPEYLGALFHKEVGETFSSYIKNYRVKKAKGLLIGTEMKIYDISSAVGYSDSKYFSRVFRETTGQHPAQFRKLNK